MIVLNTLNSGEPEADPTLCTCPGEGTENAENNVAGDINGAKAAGKRKLLQNAGTGAGCNSVFSDFDTSTGELTLSSIVLCCTCTRSNATAIAWIAVCLQEHCHLLSSTHVSCTHFACILEAKKQGLGTACIAMSYEPCTLQLAQAMQRQSCQHHVFQHESAVAITACSFPLSVHDQPIIARLTPAFCLALQARALRMPRTTLLQTSMVPSQQGASCCKRTRLAMVLATFLQQWVPMAQVRQCHKSAMPTMVTSQMTLLRAAKLSVS